MEKVLITLFFLFLVLFPFGQLTQLPVQLIGLQEIHFYLTDVVVFLMVGGWVIWRFLLVKKKYHLAPLGKPIFLFAAIAAVSLAINSPFFAGREVIVSGLYLVRWLVYAGLYFVIFDLWSHFNWLNRQNLINFLIVIGVMVAIFGLIQYFLWPNLKPLETLEWDPHFYRVVGTFLDPGFTGIILVLTLILIIKNKRWWPAMMVTYLALALTYSRTSWLAYLAAMGVIALKKKSLKFIFGVLGILGLTILLLPRPAGEGGKIGRTYSIEARVQNWQQAWTIFKDHPVLGVGFNTYRYAQRNYGFLQENWQINHAGAGADASLLFVLATTGILGFFAFLWLWFKIILNSKFLILNSPSGLGLVILTSSIALLVHSLFLNSLFYPWVMAWMWLLVSSRENK